MISKELAQKINAVRNCKTNGKWIKTCLGQGKGRRISKKYLHMLDKTFVKYEVSHICCNLLKGPVKHDSRPKFVGTTIYESQLRKTNWIKKGCNVYSLKSPQSRPLSIWTQNDISEYIRRHKDIKISNAYSKGWQRTGCMFCGFGLNIECAIRDRMFKKGIHFPTRLDLVYSNYPNAYNKYVWELGLYKPFADTYVTIPNDKKYMQYFRKRERERERDGTQKKILKLILRK
jgi:3'-phosphoadenosine 5'-phosphosulfate sulfotransferase (PAPS reductase)/FAD synthetase